MSCSWKIQLPFFPPSSCFDILFNSSSLLLFQKSFILALRRKFYRNTFALGCIFLVKYFLEEKFGIQAHMACLGSDFSVARREKRGRAGWEKFGGLWAPVWLELGRFSPYQSWESSSKPAIGGIGSIPGKEPEGQIKYLGRQDARLKRCQENQLDPKERAAS